MAIVRLSSKHVMLDPRAKSTAEHEWMKGVRTDSRQIDQPHLALPIMHCIAHHHVST